MGLFRTIILGFLAVLAVAAAIIQTQESSLGRLLGRGGFKEGENLFSFNPSRSDLILVRNGDNQAQFKRNDNGVWWGVSPWNDRMDPRAADSIIQFARGTRVVDILPLNDTVKGHMREFGVENTPIEVIIKDRRERSLSRFKLGYSAPWTTFTESEDDSSLGGVTTEKKAVPVPTIYLRTDFYQWVPEIFVVTGNITPLFKDGMRYLRDHRPLYFSPHSIKDIHIFAEGTDLTLTYGPEEKSWKLIKPIELKADQAMVSNLLGVLQQLTAIRVADPEDITILDRDSSRSKRITLSFFNDAPPVTLTIYPPAKAGDTTVLATVSDRNAVFALPVNPVDNLPGTRNLALSQKLLRAKNLVDLDRIKLNSASLRIIKDATSIVLRKTSKMWRYSENGGRSIPLNEEQLFHLLKTLTMDPVADFATDSAVDLEPYGLYDPLYCLTFGFDGAPPVTIFIGRGSVDGEFYATVNEEPTVYKLSAEYVSRLGLHSYMWRPLQLIYFNPSELERISIKSPGHEELKLDYGFMGEAWSGTQGGKDITNQINPNKANIWLDLLQAAQVVNWLPSSHIGARNALRTPSHTLTLFINPTEPIPGFEFLTETIHLSPVGDLDSAALFYGQREGDSEYFILTRDLAELFSPDLFETYDDDR